MDAEQRDFCILNQTIELTLENWDEYFEITNNIQFCKNEFGEIWRIDSIFSLQLKPEYEKRCLGSDEEFALKIKWTETTSVDANINYENETCELLGKPGYFMHYPYDFEVTNIKGLLYIAQ